MLRPVSHQALLLSALRRFATKQPSENGCTVKVIKPTNFDTAVVGQTLTGMYTNTSRQKPKYQWYRHHAGVKLPIDGATEVCYRTTHHDINTAVSFEVVFCSNNGKTQCFESLPERVEDLFLHNMVRNFRDWITFSPREELMMNTLLLTESLPEFVKTVSHFAKEVVTPTDRWYVAQQHALDAILDDSSLKAGDKYFNGEQPCDPLREMVADRVAESEALDAHNLISQHIQQFYQYSMEEKVATYHYMEDWLPRMNLLLTVCQELWKAGRYEQYSSHQELLQALHQSFDSPETKKGGISDPKRDRCALFINTVLVQAAQQGDFLLAQLLMAFKEVQFGRTWDQVYEWHYWDHSLIRIAYMKWKHVMARHSGKDWENVVNSQDNSQPVPKAPALLQHTSDAVAKKSASERKKKLQTRKKLQDARR
eukprot:GGOE01036422.1.p1 GENE.GGOE01036422.1~~GGOE01036422.1.p1  ORF type:complete len:424 (-),score=75.07 GGOE01036422.1:143-1414(-)